MTLPHPRVRKGRRFDPRSMNSASAFTLIELLVVIGIIAVLAGILLPTITSVRRNAMENTIKAQLKLLEVALKAYESDWGTYPPDTAAINASGGLPGVNPVEKGEDLYIYLGSKIEMPTYTRNAGPYMEFKLDENCRDNATQTGTYPAGYPQPLSNATRRHAVDTMGEPWRYLGPWQNLSGTALPSGKRNNRLSYDLFSYGVNAQSDTTEGGTPQFILQAGGDDVSNWD